MLDTCVLYPFSLCDLLLRLAERELYDPFWSERILRDLERVLTENRLTPEQAGRRVTAMRRAFPEAMVSTDAVARLEPAMTSDPGDRHVLAAAVESGADAIVTQNLRHFSPEACEPHGVDVIHPDEFLVNLYDLDPATVRRELHRQAAQLTRPPVSWDELVAILEKAGLTKFVQRIRTDG